MKKLKTIFALGCMAFAIASCNNTQNSNTSTNADSINSEVQDEHTAQNSLDWQGSYFGILPCADCEGIATTLRLNDDLTYTLTEVYQGKGDGADHIARGKFSWQGNNIKLEGLAERPLLYKVEENRIRSLDMNGKAIEGELADRYILTKEGNPEVENKRWQLVELYGKPIKGTPTTHYIIFHSKDGMLEAKANCNTFSYQYSIRNSLQIKLIPGVSTLMACPENTEDELKKALDVADNISYAEKSLSLNKARMAPLVRFELVEE